MYVPIHDDNPRRRFPVFTAAGTVALGVITMATLLEIDLGLLAPFGYGVPNLWDPELEQVVSPIRIGHRLVISLFAIWQVLHLWTFADNVEDHWGAPLFAPAMMIIGMVGWAVAGGAEAELLGGFPQAVGGAVVVCYAVLYPRQSVQTFVLRPLHRRLDVPGFSTWPIHTVVIAYFIGQIILGFLLPIPIVPLIVGAILGLGLAAFGITVHGRPDHHVLDADAASGDGAWVDVPVPEEPSRSESGSHETAPAPPSPFVVPAMAAPPARGHAALRWAVIRTEDDLEHLDRIARIVMSFTHEPRFDVVRRLRQIRGVIALDLDETPARDLADAIRGVGVEALATPWPDPPLQVPVVAAAVAWSERSIAIQAGERPGQETPTFDIPWRRVRVAAATRVRVAVSGSPGPTLELDEFVRIIESGGEPSFDTPSGGSVVTTIDILVEPNPREPYGAFTPPARFTVVKGRSVFAVDRPTGGFEECARALVSHRGVLAVNEGLEKIADPPTFRGRWGYLEFRSRAPRDLYLAWLAALAHPRNRGGAVSGHAAARAEEGASVTFLE